MWNCAIFNSSLHRPIHPTQAFNSGSWAQRSDLPLVLLVHQNISSWLARCLSQELLQQKMRHTRKFTSPPAQKYNDVHSQDGMQHRLEEGHELIVHNVYSDWSYIILYYIILYYIISYYIILYYIYINIPKEFEANNSSSSSEEMVSGSQVGNYTSKSQQLTLQKNAQKVSPSRFLLQRPKRLEKQAKQRRRCTSAYRPSFGVRLVHIARTATLKSAQADQQVRGWNLFQRCWVSWDKTMSNHV